MILKETLPIHVVEIDPGNYHLFIASKIGRNNAWLLLDTGASKTAFDFTKIEAMLGTHKQEVLEMNSVGLGSNQVQTHLRTLSSMKFGAIKLAKVEVAVLDLSHVNDAYEMLGFKQIDGVIGSDILIALKAQINMEKMLLHLKYKSE